jgi:hypothetical protein
MPAPGLEHLPGTALPEGTFTISETENQHVLDVVGGVAAADGSAHPLWAYIAPQRGIGIGIKDLCALADFDVDDGPMLGSSELELHAPIKIGAEYRVTGEVLSIERKQGGSGTFDVMAFREDLLDGEQLVAVSTSTYILPRKGA